MLFSSYLFSQLAWNYTRINGTGGLAKSSLPSSFPSNPTSSNYPNIILHPNSNVDQSEMSISSDPSNYSKLLVGGNSVIQTFSPIHYNQGYYYSTNEGENWNGSDTLPTTGNLSDPAVAYDLNGNAFFAFLKYTGVWNIAVKKSTNGSSIWGSDVIIPNTGDPDKEHLAIDVNSSSPYKNFLYTAWTDFSISPRVIKFSRSTNGGSNWSSAINISGTSGYSLAQGVCLSVGPTGTLYATWAFYDVGSSYENALGFNFSTNGGSTWSTPSRISINGFSGMRGYLSKGTVIRIASFPSMDVDTSNGANNGTIYIVWANAGDAINHTNSDIYLVKSSNSGTTWSNKIKINNDITTTDQWEPWINVDKYGGINIVFYDSRTDPTNNVLSEIYMARSIDGGTTISNYLISDYSFTPSMIPNTAYGYMGDYVGITSTRENAILCWNDNRSGVNQAYAAKFDILLDLAYANKSASYYATAYNNNHTIERGYSSKIHEVFHSGGEIFYRRSSNSGSIWEITTRLSSGNGSNDAPSIVAG